MTLVRAQDRGVDWLDCSACATRRNSAPMKVGYACDWPTRIGHTCGKVCCRVHSMPTAGGKKADAKSDERALERWRTVNDQKDYCPMHQEKIREGHRPPTIAGPKQAIVRTVCTAGWPVSAGYALCREAPVLVDLQLGDVYIHGMPQDTPPGWNEGFFINAHLDAELFTKTMRSAWLADRAVFDQILSGDKVVLACYCLSPAGCRRFTLAEILVKLGARYDGEL